VGFGTGVRGVVAHAELHPHDFGADRDRLVDRIAAAALRRKTSTMSIGSGTSASAA